MDIVLLTDVCSADPDDIIALIYVLSKHKNNQIKIKGIIASHFFTDVRAQIIQLILDHYKITDVPVVLGHGLRSTDHYNERFTFSNDNPLFPLSLFGSPYNIKNTDEKQWFPNFAVAYKEYAKNNNIDVSKFEFFDNTKEKTYFLNNLLSQYNSSNKLKVICIAPLHDLTTIHPPLLKNMELYVMGGGRDDLINIDEFIGAADKQKISLLAGYNWGITPNITNKFIDQLNNVGEKMTLISSGFVRTNKFVLSESVYAKWQEMTKNNEHKNKVMAQTILKDFVFCNKSNVLLRDSYLCDPLTALVAVIDKSEYDTYPINISIRMPHYLDKSLEIINMEKSDNPNCFILVGVKKCEQKKQQMIQDIENFLFELN